MEEIALCYNGEERGARLDSWLSEELPEYTRSFIQKLIEDGSIKVNNMSVKSGYKLKKGDNVSVEIPEPAVLNVEPQNIPIDIVYEDSDILVVNKQKNMVVHPAAGNPDGTLVNALLYHCRDSLSDINGVIRPGIIHRIDKDTTGLLCVAKNNEAHLFLAKQLKDHSMKRTYLALVDGKINEETGTVDAPIGRHPTDRKKMTVNTRTGREAVTHFRVIKRFEKYTLLELSLETGRTHQIRVHMSYIGHPVSGDETYGKRFPFYDTQGQVLHAFKLELVHPTTKKNQVFFAPTPDYIDRIIKILEK